MNEPSARRSFFAFTVERRVAVAMVFLAVCVFGSVGLQRLPVNLLPDVSYPTVTVRTEYPGAGPRDIEERISERVEELVSVAPGVRRVYSVSRPGVSDVVLEFAWGTPMVFAVQEVRERLDRFFPPAGAGRPLVLRYDPALDPVLTLGLSAEQDHDLIALRNYADLELEERLAQVEGVAAVSLRGGDEEEIRVSVDDQALTAKGLDIAAVAARIGAENMNAASGVVEEGRTEFLVRTLNEYRDLQEIGDTIVARRGETSIRLREVARVERLPREPEVISRVGGRPCVLLDVRKEADANIVDLCRRVRELVFGTEAQQRAVAAGRHLEPLAADVEAEPLQRQAALRQRAAMTDFLAFELRRQGMGIALLSDQSTFIQQAVDDVLGNAIQGGILAILVILLFLRRLPPTAIMAVSIPISLLATFAPMFLSDIDLNIMSLGGLALGVGMLVDNSIVVLESIVREREAGADRRTAAVRGTSRVAGAVIASTLTTVAVFAPIVFVEGLAGQIFRDQALTVVYALLLSLLVALFLVPMLASLRMPAATPAPGALGRGPAWIVGDRPRGRGFPAALGWLAFAGLLPLRAVGFLLTWLLALALLVVGGGVRLLLRGLGVLFRPVGALFQAAYDRAERAYPAVLGLALRRRGLVLTAALLLLAAAGWRGAGLGTTILPDVHQGEFWLEAFLSRASTVRNTDEVATALERRIAALPEVERTFVASGTDPEELNDSEQGKHSARIQVRLRPAPNRAEQEERTRDAIAAIVRTEPAVLSHRFAVSSVLQFRATVVIELVGHDLVDLRRACDEVTAALAAIPDLRDARATLQRGNPELSIRLDRDRLAALGIEAEVIARQLRAKVQGEVPTLFAEREKKIDLRVRMAKEELATEAALRALNVNPQGYPEIPLSTVAEITRREGPSEIRHLGSVRGAEVTADVQGFDLGRAQLRAEAALAGLDLPQGVEARLGGQKRDMEQSRQSLLLALGLAVFLVYVVMASQFESIVQPLVLMASVPLALIGVVLGLELSGLEVSVIAFLGGIVLAGIVVNNAIVLIDQVNQLRAEGMPKAAAIVEGGRRRLRPVLMTTLTTLLGLLPQTGWLVGVPFLGGGSEGLELRAPLAVVVIAGLASSTLLTLVVVPVVYSLADRRP